MHAEELLLWLENACIDPVFNHQKCTVGRVKIHGITQSTYNVSWQVFSLMGFPPEELEQSEIFRLKVCTFSQ